MKKTLASVVVAAMLLAVGCTGTSDISITNQSYSPLDFSGSTLTAQVQKVSGQQLTLSIGGRGGGMQTGAPRGNPDAQAPQNTQTPAPSAAATTSADTVQSDDATTSADATASAEATPSATPEASSTNAQQMLPDMPGQSGRDNLPADINPGSAETATAQMIVPDGDLVYVLNGNEETQGSMEDIKENSIIHIEFGENNKITKITVIN